MRENADVPAKTLAGGMGYIEANLVASEEIIFSTRRHWVVLLGPILIVGLLAILALATSAQETNEASTISIWLFLLAIVILIIRLLRWRATEIALTNKRLILKSGVLSHRSEEIMVDKVESILVNQGLMGRVLNYGTLVLRGTGSSFEPLADVPAPMQLRKCVLDQVSRLARSTYAR